MTKTAEFEVEINFFQKTSRRIVNTDQAEKKSKKKESYEFQLQLNMEWF